MQYLFNCINEILPHGVGFDDPYTFTWGVRSKLKCKSSYTVINNGKFKGYIYFTITIDMIEKTFSIAIAQNSCSRYLAREYGFKEYITEKVGECLKDHF